MSIEARMSDFSDGGMSDTFWVEAKGGGRVGLFFGSYDKKRHLAPYVPHERPPRAGEVLCGGLVGILTATRSEDNLCQECLAWCRSRRGDE